MPRMDAYETGVPCWAELSTTDPESAVDFYTTVFGWEHEAVPTGTDEPYHMFSQDGAYVTACMRQPEELAQAGVPPVFTVYLAGPADEIAARVPDAGGQIVNPPFDVPGSGRMAIIAEPGGAVFGVWEAGDHIGAELVNEPVSMTWNELNTTDLAASATFLEQVFGVATEDLPAGESGYKTFGTGADPDAQASGGIMQMTEEWEGIPPHWMTYFAVADTDAACTAIREAGGGVNIDPFDTEFGRIAVVSDRQGAHFSIMGPVGTSQ